jgi:WD40 repeat protein/serine/threonine protein kinase
VTEESPVEAIFFAALQKATATERAAFLDEACAHDEDLRRRVERLLAVYPQAGAFLERPVAEAANVAALAPPDTWGGSDAPPGSEGRAKQPEAGEPLDFLAPSQKPNSLGRLGHYEVLEVVGRGGMGVVLRAFDDKLHRVVAIKVLAPQLASSAAARQRFVREARAAAAVTHDNVIDIHAVEDAGPVPFLVMQFIHGCSLQEKLDRAGPLPVKEVLRIGLQTAAGLAAAHAQGLVHRDVKPANILLENSIERVKITDFGLARAVDDASLTQSGFVAGTPAFMSPEQAHGARVDHRTDLFGLGSVLYTLCAGHPPFRADTSMAVLKRVCEDTPRPLREVNPDIPDWLEAIIARLHAKDPADRFQKAAAVADLLGRHLAHLQQPGIVPLPVAQTSSLPRPAGRKPSPRVAAVLFLLAVAALAVGAAVYQLLGRRNEVKTPDTSNGAAQEAPPWKPRPPLTLEELAKLRSPLDALKREAMKLPPDAPPELLAVLGDPVRFPLPAQRTPQQTTTHWMAQTGDGRLLAVPWWNTILLFDAHTGALLRTLTGHAHETYRPAFSPDGKRLAAGAYDPILLVWDVATGRAEPPLTDHKHPVWCVAFDHEGKRLVSADSGGTVKVRDADGREITTLSGHTKGVHHLAFSPDGKRLATASLDGTCKVWDTDTWKEIRSLPAHGKTFMAVAWSRNGKLLAAGEDDQVILWNADTYKVLHALPTPGKGMVAFTPDGRTLLTARTDCNKGERHAFTRWDVMTGKQQKPCVLSTHGGLAFFHLSPDGRTVFVSYPRPAEPRVGEYDAKTGQERFPPRGGPRGSLIAVAFSPDGRTLASGGADQTVRLWDLAGWRPGEPSPPIRAKLEGHTDQVWSVAFSPDGKLLASGGNDGRIRLWDVASGHKVRELTGHSTECAYLTFSPDGRTIVAGGTNGTVNHWDALTGQPKEPWRWHAAAGEVRPVAYSPDGRLLASGGRDGTVQLLDAATGLRRDTFPRAATGQRPPFFCNLAFSPDGRTLAAVTDAPNAPVRLTINPETRKLVLVKETPSATLHLWDVETKTERRLTGHTDHIPGLSFHPGGKLVATASFDGTVRLWGVTPPSSPGREGLGVRGQAVRVFDFRSSGKPWCAAFTPEGRYLAAGLENGTIAILRVPALPPVFVPAPAAKLPAPADLAKRVVAADALKREDIPEELLKKAGGDKDKALAELVAIFGEDRHAQGHQGCQLATVAFSPDGKTLAFGGTGNAVRLIDLEAKPPREQTWKQRGSEATVASLTTVASLAFSPDGKVLACGKGNGSILLWDVAAGAELPPLPSPDDGVARIAFSPDGTLLAAAGQVNSGAVVRLWKVATGQLLFTSHTPGDWIAWCVAFSPDGKTLAAGLQSGEVRLFDVDLTREIPGRFGWQVATLAGHGGKVRWLGFHPDGRSLVVAGELTDHTVFVWDLATRKQPRRLPGHDSEVLTGAWRADGRLLITAGSLDGMVRLWDPSGDAPRSRALGVIPPKVPWLYGIALSPEGRHLAVTNPNGTVYVLRLAKAGEVFEVPK